ncbi:MAG: hypothetical protein KBB11_04935 [Bacteroidales bacterium]|nr:hypothetical protein [Bacteroidales bacterium]HOY38592.1 hypothetical protein [Bacteroidales bacterium]
MKKINFFFIFTFAFLTAFGQVPMSFKYQAVIRDAEGHPFDNQNLDVRISIIAGEIGGTAVCQETFDTETNAFGLVTLEIGSQNPTDFSQIDWTEGPYFVKIEIDLGDGFTEFGTSQLLAVPFAIHSKTAESLTGEITETDPIFSGWDKDYNDLTNTPILPVVPENVSEFNNDAGYLTEDTETDPVFGASVANGITAIDTAHWNALESSHWASTGDNINNMNSGNVGVGIVTSLSFEKDKTFKEIKLTDDEIKQLIIDIAETNALLQFSGKDYYAKVADASYSGLTINGNELWYISFHNKPENTEAREIINKHFSIDIINNNRQIITRDSKGKPVDYGIIISKAHPNICALRKNLKGGYVNSAANSCLVAFILLAMIALICWNIFA